eukprot:TRINITY_DN7242_c0_g1_i1.p1 TRINITY_DN7242_c0_g1~~TRINITY_DN7242_c0_g1_i1.p1  ORF type:complete len:392 (+),score=40.46 TRINITY_DN7242_c0_g1_i1:35-1210(+)
MASPSIGAAPLTPKDMHSFTLLSSVFVWHECLENLPSDICVTTSTNVTFHEPLPLVRAAINDLIGFRLTAVSHSCKAGSKHDEAIRQAITALHNADVSLILLGGRICIDFGCISQNSESLPSRLSTYLQLSALPEQLTRFIDVQDPNPAMARILTTAIFASANLLRARQQLRYNKLLRKTPAPLALQKALKETTYYDLGCIGSRLFGCPNSHLKPNSPVHAIIVAALAQRVQCPLTGQLVSYEIIGDRYKAVHRVVHAGRAAALVDDDQGPLDHHQVDPADSTECTLDEQESAESSPNKGFEHDSEDIFDGSIFNADFAFIWNMAAVHPFVSALVVDASVLIVSHWGLWIGSNPVKLLIWMVIHAVRLYATFPCKHTCALLACMHSGVLFL